MKIGSLMNETDIQPLIEKIYDAVDAPEHWPIFLEQFADAFHCEGCLLYLHDFSSRRSLFEHGSLSFVQHTRFDPSYMTVAHELFDNGLNVWLENSKQIPEGVPFISSRIFPDDELPGTVFYNEWLKPQGLFYGIGGVVLQREDMVIRLSAARARKHGPLTRSDEQNYRKLMPHLRRACNLHIKLAEVRALRDSSQANLNLLPFGVILLNRNGKALFCNRAATNIIEGNNGFKLDAKGYCCSATARETKALQTLIRDAIETDSGKGRGMRGSMKLTHTHSEQPLLIQVSPFSGHPALPFDIPCAVLFLSVPGKGTNLSPELLSSLYGLTPSEARLATSLAMGIKLDQFANGNHTSISTVRAQLKQTFKKTETHSQVDLARLILTGPAIMQDVIATYKQSAQPRTYNAACN